MITALDGRPLDHTLYGEPTRGVLVVNGATAVPRKFYKPFAERFAKEGWLVVTYDYRMTREARMTEWGTLDQAGVLAWAAKTYPDAPLAGVGHSAGGQLAGIAPGNERYQAFIGAAAQSGYWKLWPAPLRYRRWADMTVILPGITRVTGSVPKWALGQALPGKIAREWAWWCRHPDYILRDDSAARRAAFSRVTARMLMYSFEGDSFGPPASIDWLANQFVNARVERRHVTEGKLGHFGYFRPHATQVWEESAAFLAAGR